MNKTLILLVVLLAGAVMVVFLWSRPVAAQSRQAGAQEVDSLIERIKSARARDARLYGEDGAKTTDEEATGERTPAVDKKPVVGEKTKDAERQRAERMKTQIDRSTRDVGAYAKEMAAPTRTTTQDVLKPYETDRTMEGLLARIRESRSEEAEKEKAKREKTEKESVLREPASADLRTPAPDVATYRRFLAPTGSVTGTVGGEMLMQKPSQTPAGVAAIRNTVRPSGLPDPTKESSLYDTQVQREQGVRAQLPRYAETNLLGIYEAQRYGQLLSQRRDVQIDPQRMDPSQVYKTYQQFQRTPDTGSTIGLRDVYVPNSTSFVNPTYRGSIYGLSNATDPYRLNYSLNTTASRYSSLGYYNLDVREAYVDYYTREFGVGRNFVPNSSSSRAFEVNTVKQWTQDLRNSYGVNIRPGDTSYSDLYRMRTSQPR